jgi:hypothetical protein
MLVLSLGLTPGCFDVNPAGPRPDGDGDVNNPDGGGNGGDDPDGDTPDDADTVPQVRLTVSNVSPQPGEELQLTCDVTSGSSAGVTFEFAPEPAGMVVDDQAGTAYLLIEDIDVGIAYSFTCTGTNSAGTGPASDAVLVVASAPVGPVP